MISSDLFYQMEIEGKSAEQIEELIHELESEISSLEFQIMCKRSYVDRAKRLIRILILYPRYIFG